MQQKIELQIIIPSTVGDWTSRLTVIKLKVKLIYITEGLHFSNSVKPHLQSHALRLNTLAEFTSYIYQDNDTSLTKCLFYIIRLKPI